MTGERRAAAPDRPPAWMDLLGDLTGSRVLVLGGSEPSTDRRTAERWDVIVLDGTTGEARLPHLASCVEPGGRLVVVGDNRLSPLRAFDRLTGRPAGPAGPRLGRIERVFDAAGLAVVQRFGLLRSSVAAVTGFDMDAPNAADAVLRAASVTTEGVRLVGLEILRWAARHHRAGPLVPAWMVVAARPGERNFGPQPTGRIGHTGTTEPKLVWGEPPAELEKRYSNVDDADREAMALSVLAAAGLPGVARLVSRPGPDRSRLTWLTGRPLVPHRLGRRRAGIWTVRAARAIAAVHRSTARPDGTALLHGDFWLGNVLVDGEQVVGIVDWTGARWGDPADDVAHLVATSSALLTDLRASRLDRLARAAHLDGMAAGCRPLQHQ